VERFQWTPGGDKLEGDVLELVLPSRQIAYLQYLTIGNLGVFARVLSGHHASPLSGERLIALVADEDSFVTQCGWAELARRQASRGRGQIPVPSAVWKRFAVRVAPGIEDLDESLFLISDGHVWRGRDVRLRFPEVDLSRAPMGSCPSIGLLLERIELGWTPAVEHDRKWLKRAREEQIADLLQRPD
jgi:hypothetical protein